MKPATCAVLILTSMSHAQALFALSAAELKIYSPVVEYHELEIETRSFISGQGAAHEQGHAFSAGYSPNARWHTEVYEVLHKDPDLALVAKTIEWENVLALAQAGEFWLDPGVLGEFELAQQAGTPSSFRLAPLIEKQFGSEVLSLNFPLEWKFGPNFVPGTGFSYAARFEHLLNIYLSPAVEAFGEPGIIGNWQRASTQSHLLGPAIYGAAHIGEKQKLKYSVASLFGLTNASPDWTIVTRLEFEF